MVDKSNSYSSILVDIASILGIACTSNGAPLTWGLKLSWMAFLQVGLKKLDQVDGSQLLVFGGRPGDPRIGIPGKRVGYMPQVSWPILIWARKLCLLSSRKWGRAPMFHLNVTILKMDKILFSPNSCTCIRVSLTDSAARIIFLLLFFSYHVEPLPGFEPTSV